MKYVVYILIAFALWLLFTFSLAWDNLMVGAVVAVVTVLLFGRYFVNDVDKLLQPKRYFWWAVYLLVLTWECIKANFDVAYRVLHYNLPIKPGIVKVKTNLKSAMGRTTLANSITITPGTITVDMIGDEVYVHWIYVSSSNPEEYAQKICGRFEKYIQKIFE